MYSYKDTTFCISPHCENKCQRQLTDDIKNDARRLGMPLSVGYFCDLPDFLKNEDRNE